MKLPFIPEIARPFLLLAAILLIVLLPGLALRSCQEARQAQGEARMAEAATQAATASGQDAVNTTGAVADRAADGDALTRENEHAIRYAKDAAAVHAAALDGLCKRAAYQCDPNCVQRNLARGVAAAGARCAPAAR